MASMKLRPDLRTAGGEVNDILYNNRFVGTLTLVYRDSDRMAGSLQLEQETLSEREKEDVSEQVHEYVQALVDAMNISECEVMVTFSSFDHVLASESETEEDWDFSEEEDQDTEVIWVDDNTRFGDEGAGEQDEYTMQDYELVIVGESRNAVEYHVYGADEEWVAEAFMSIVGREVNGTVKWMVMPEEDDLDIVADLIVHDFDEKEIDSFVIEMRHADELIETIELAHEELLEDEEDLLQAGDDADSLGREPSPYSVVLVRDDGDVLHYEIYEQSRGRLPIGTATIDISQKQLTGFVDFRDPGTEEGREQIAALLMQELDKEKDYETFNVSMMHNNRLIEELLFETEQVH